MTTFPVTGTEYSVGVTVTVKVTESPYVGVETEGVMVVVVTVEAAWAKFVLVKVKKLESNATTTIQL
jgi:hypothetical protein